MAQFQVCRIGTGRLVLDLQTDLVGTGTRVVAPLLPLATSPKPLTILEPVFEIEGVPHVLHTAEMAAVPAGPFGPPVADVTGRDYESRRAIDMVFSGF